MKMLIINKKRRKTKVKKWIILKILYLNKIKELKSKNRTKSENIIEGISNLFGKYLEYYGNFGLYLKAIR